VVLLTADTRRMMSTAEVQAEVSAGSLARETLVWRAGMSEWVAIASIVELDVPVLRQPQHAPPAPGWNSPAVQPPAMNHGHGQPHAHGHGHQRQPQRPTVISPAVTQELMTTGAVAVIMVAMTLYLLSLGGAFAPGSAHHAGGHADSAASGATAQKSH
jgi:hypothetical protein